MAVRTADLALGLRVSVQEYPGDNIVTLLAGGGGRAWAAYGPVQQDAPHSGRLNARGPYLGAFETEAEAIAAKRPFVGVVTVIGTPMREQLAQRGAGSQATVSHVVWRSNPRETDVQALYDTFEAFGQLMGEALEVAGGRDS